MYESEDSAAKASASGSVNINGTSCTAEKMKKREDLACRVFVGDLKAGVADADIRKAFARYGTITNIVIKSG